jgi:drug/metabolite transporter (DMT)-like permease
MNKKTLGVLLILGAATMWALDVILIKLSYYNASFTDTMTIRALGILLVATGYVFITNKGSFKLKKSEAVAALASGLLGSTIASVLYLYALQTTTAFTATFLGHLQPLFVIIMAHLFLSHEKLNRSEKIGFVLMILAGFLVTTRTVENFTQLHFGTTGHVLMIIAAILWSTTVIFARKYLQEANAGLVAFYRFAITSVIIVTYTVVTSEVTIANMYQVIVGITTGIGLILWYEGARYIKGVVISALELFGVFCTGILGYFILNETVTWMQGVGMILLIAGVWYLSRDEEPI